MHRLKELNTKEMFIDHVYGTCGESPIYFEITNEFNKFQDTLKQDWLRAHADEKEENWDNRKYFIEDAWINKKDGRVFIKYVVHKDVTQQVMPYYFDSLD